MSIRWKLFITNLSVALIAIAILGGYTEHALRGYFLRELEESLTKGAQMARDLAEANMISGRPNAVDNLAKRLYHETGYRLTYINSHGKVLGDGEQDPRTMRSHASRPEVKDALRYGRGVQVRHSDTLNADMLYVAIPARYNSASTGVVRAAIPLTQLDAALGRTRATLAVVILIAILLAMLLSARLANRIAGPIQELHARAARIAAGDLDQRISSDSPDEIGDLARAFGQMTSQVKAMLAAAMEEQNKIRAIFAGMSEGILVVDPAGQVTLLNEAARTALDPGQTGPKAGSVIEVTRSHEIDAIVVKAAQTLEPQHSEIQLQFPEERILSLLATPVTDALGKHIATITLLHDITEIRRLERIRRDFAASASHELRTPITSIRVMAESLLAGADEDPDLREQFLRAILDSSNRQAALVDDLLTLSTLEHPSTVLERQPVSVSELVSGVLPLFEHRARQQGLTLQISVPKDIRIQGDAHLLDHALTNLLDNAIKYTPAGSVMVSAERQGDWVLLRVSDTGSGIPSQHLSRIFERFYRVDKARSRELGGTGLGLSIVKHVVEEHEGTVTVESQLGRGSSFTLRLPAA